MSYIGILNLNDSIKKQTFDNNQICFLSKDQCGMVGDTFSLDNGREVRHYKMIDIWSVPQDFAKKFLWRLCGLDSIDDLQDGQTKNFAHIYVQISWNKLQNMVKS